MTNVEMMRAERTGGVAIVELGGGVISAAIVGLGRWGQNLVECMSTPFPEP